ncbi:sensor histidine kinase [Mucilaginibacter sp. SP1R1]|uniref:sensor histidine kinase n=1 Tax=Mucilaginibacter sp. SP1R1 TaxID=2723091 RepID=UPI00160BD810|nr:HAMP domain-containing sensor histidine kinase [Mucilaginibacter sp. SP1R1]MBB6148317.1 signal transduction histidine kinase [Mucilaginibacter sp. SP1R1]
MKGKLINSISGIKALKKKITIVLLIIVMAASAAIIIMNYFTIKIISAAGASINGESQHYKGQKEASAYLTNYIYLQNESDYIAFQKAIDIPLSDSRARITLSSENPDYQEAAADLLKGQNHSEDIGDLIWMFRRFEHLGAFKEVIKVWVEGDAILNKIIQIASKAHQKIAQGKISGEERKALILSIRDLSARSAAKGEDFRNTLGAIIRTTKIWVFIANVLITIVIVISSLSYAGIMIRNLADSKRKIIEQNEKLEVINSELDKFVYNVTHDLRSPLTALAGLIGLINDETDLDQIRAYTLMMKGSLEKQDRFINEMLIFVKSKHTGINKAACNLTLIVDDVIAQNSFRNEGKAVKFYKELELNIIESDALKLQVILNNLISNSVKYCDPKKMEQWVKVKSYHSETDTVIEVEDNGIGILLKDQERIFDEFYMSGDNKKSSGIGLYLVKDAVTQLNGRIEVQSASGVSSKFIVSIPRWT